MRALALGVVGLGLGCTPDDKQVDDTGVVVEADADADADADTDTDSDADADTDTDTDTDPNDSGFGGPADYAVNHAPSIWSDPNQQASEGEGWRYPAMAEDPDGDLLTWSLTEAPGDMAITAEGMLHWAPGDSDVGTYNVSVQVVDPYGALDEQTFSLNVAAGTQPPVFTTTPDLSATASTTWTYSAAVEDPDDTSFTWSVSGPSGMSVDSSGNVSWSVPSSASGSEAVTLTVSDGLNQVDQVFTIGIGGDGVAPTISISSPSDGDDVTGRIDITGSVTDDSLAGYTVTACEGDSCQTLEEGLVPVSSGTLATLDPHVLPDGNWTITITAEDGGGASAETEVDVSIESEKFGSTRLAFDDLYIETNGGSFTLTRVYDGLDLSLGELGYGWSYKWETGTVDVPENIHSGWSVQYSGGWSPYFYVVSTSDHELVYTETDGTEHAFLIELEVEPGLGSILGARLDIYDVGGTGASLSIYNSNGSAYSSSSYDTLYVTSGGTTIYEDLSFNPWNPGSYEITTADGRSIAFAAEDGEQDTFWEGDVEYDLEDGEIRLGSTTLVVFEYDQDGFIIAAEDQLAGTRVDYVRDSNEDLVESTPTRHGQQTFTYGSNHRLIDYDLPGIEPEIWEYDSDGRLISHTAPTGEYLHYAYDDPNRMVVQTDAEGNTVITTHDAAGRVVRVEDPLGNVTTQTYSGDEIQPTTVTDPLGNTTTFAYDSEGRKTSITDANGDTTSFGYQEGSDTLISITDGEGRVFQEVVGSDDRLSGYMLPDGSYATTFSYSGDTITTTDARGNSISRTYDSRGRVTEEVTEEGETITTVYDDTQRTSTIYEPDGRVDTVTNDTSGRITSIDYDSGDQLEYIYSSGGRLEEVVRPDGALQTWTHDASGRMTELQVDGVTVQTVRYDSLGRIASKWSAGGTTTYRYDAVGRVIETTTDAGTVSYTYDAAGNLIRVANDDGGYQDLEYDGAGQNTAIVDAAGYRTDLVYDRSGLVTELTDPMGRVIGLTYDANGYPSIWTYPDGSTEQAGWGSVLTVEGSDPESSQGRDGVNFDYSYDSSGLLTQVTDPDGYSTSFSYESSALVEVVDAAGRSWSWTRTGESYDLVHPGGDVESWEYSGSDLLWTRTDGTVVDMVATADGHEMTLPDGSVLSVSLDSTGLRSEKGASGGTHWLLADASDRVVWEETDAGASVAYDWSSDGLLTELMVTLPNGTTGLTTYTHDVNGWMVEIEDPNGGITTLDHDDSGRVTAVDYPDGSRTESTYTVSDRPATVEHFDSSGASLGLWDLLYEGVQVSSIQGPELGYDFTYDSLGRLSQAIEYDGTGSVTDTWNSSWDEVGNLVQRSSDSGTESWTYDDDDRLLTAGSRSFSWSDRGALEQVSDGADVTDYVYDDLDRLMEVYLPDGSSVTYTYDVSGRLMSRTGSDGVEWMCVPMEATPFGHSDCAAWATGTGEVRWMVHGPEGALGQTGDDEAWFHKGLNGTVDAITDSSQSQLFRTDPWGGSDSDVGYGWIGERQDPETGLVYLRARWYDPSTGRFLTPDTYPGASRDPRTIHRYAYGAGDPINKLDRSGEFFSLSGMMAAVNIRSTLSSLATRGIALCARQAVIDGIGEAFGTWVGQMARNAIAPGIQAALMSLGVPAGVMPGETTWSKALADILCGGGSDDLTMPFEFEVDVTTCGVRTGSKSSGCSGSSNNYTPSSGIDILFAGHFPIELKLKSGTFKKKQLVRYCRFASLEHSFATVYGWWKFPTDRAHTRYAELCWKCWKKEGNMAAGACSKEGAFGSIYVAFGMRKNRSGKRVYKPNIPGLCG